MAYIGNGIAIQYVEANNVGSAQVIDFAITSNDLSNTGVVAGTYGNSSAIPVITVDQAGRVVSAVTNAVAGVTGFTYNGANSTFTITTGAGSSFDANIAANTISQALTDTGVAAGTYGNTTAIPVITIDAKGRVTSATTNSVSGVTGLSWSAANNTLTVSTSIGSYTANLSNWSGAVSISSTLAAGNTTINGFANVTSTLQVGNTSSFAGLITGTITSANNADYLDGQHGSYYSGLSDAAYSNAVSVAATDASTKAATAYSNAVSTASADATTKAATAYSNAVSVAATDASTKAATAYSNATTYAATAAGIAYSNAVSTAATDASTKAAAAYSNAVSTAAADASTKAAAAYSNSTSYAATIAGTAYSNAVSIAATDASTKADTAYSNAISTSSSDATTKAATAYSNAVAYAATVAGTAYSNAVSTASADASSKAATAYSNAVAYAASNTYVNNTFAPKAGPVFTGTAAFTDVTISGNLTTSGTVTYINSTNLNIGDNVVTLNADIGATAPTENAGIEINRGTSANVAIRWNEASDIWQTTTDGTTYLTVATNNDVSVAYSNAVSTASADATSKAATAYSNATTYATTIAATAYSNATSYAATIAGTAYSNAVAYAASNTYVNTQLGLKANLSGATFSGAVSGITTLAAGNTTVTGFANVSSTLTVGANTYTSQILNSYNSASSLAAFDVSKTTLGGIHFVNGSGGGSGSGKEAAITFQGSSATEAQAGIYVHNDNSEGTHMAFATTDSYATGPQIGFRLTNTGTAYFPRSYVTASGSFRAPIFYDSDNTSYYLDPASTSKINNLTLGSYTTNQSLSGQLILGDVGNNYLFTQGSWTSSITAGILANCNDNWEFAIHDSGTSVVSPFAYMSSTGYIYLGRDIGWGTSVIYAPNSVRSPIFYDSDNTNYYVDPAGSTSAVLAGYVGVACSPAARLHLQTSTSSSAHTLLISDGTGSARVGHWDGVTTRFEYSGKPVIHVVYGSGNYLALGAGGSEQLRIISGGNVGIGNTAPTDKLRVEGSFSAITKSFLIAHPTKEGKQLRYASLEGPENGVYVRGRLQGSVIELPEYWTKLVDPDSITVQLTPVGSFQMLFVEKIVDNKVFVVTEGQASGIPNCHYTVYAERIDVARLEVETD